MVSLSGSYHLLRIGLRPAETRFACDLHNSGLDLWSIEGEKNPALCLKALGHCRHLVFLVFLVCLTFFAFNLQVSALKHLFRAVLLLMVLELHFVSVVRGDKADGGDCRRWEVSWEVLERFHLK